MPDIITDYRSMLAPLIAKVGQAEAARRAGIPQPNISVWLRGERGMSLERQLALASALGCRVKLTVKEPA